jgi:hypothetical protein
MKHIMRWSPDSCGCVIDIEWDDSVPVEQRSHVAKNIVSRCPAHQQGHFTDHHEHYDIILKENQRKNNMHKHFMEQFPHLTEEVPEDVTEGHILTDNISAEEPPKEKARRLKKGVKYIYSWTGEGKDRVLQVKFQGADLKDNEKKILKDKVGTDKVIVV